MSGPMRGARARLAGFTLPGGPGCDERGRRAGRFLSWQDHPHRRRLQRRRRIDTYSRAIARHLAKHVPGKPSVIVENMPGAAGLIAANSIYRAGRPDGLTIVNFQGTQVVGQILGREGVEFDARKFE
jgi:hypothetical protein